MPSDPNSGMLKDLFHTPVPQRTDVWHILIVDDEPEVFEATRFALKGVRILDRPITLHQAESATAAEEFLTNHPDTAVALIDVVMETNDAGLRLVSNLRKQGQRDLRLILRTGQPGYAPELTVISDYEINDYMCKDDLTRTRLISLLTTALRDYTQIRQLNEYRKGLELVINSTQDLLNRKGLNALAEGILTQLAALLDLPAQGIVCAASMTAGAKDQSSFVVLSGLGAYAKDTGRPLVMLDQFEERLASAFTTARELGEPVPLEDGLAAVFDNPGGRAYFVFVEGRGKTPSPMGTHLLRLFTANIALCFENLDMVDQLNDLAFTDSSLQIPNRNALARRVDQMTGSEGLTRLVIFSLDTVMDITSVFGTKTAIFAFLAYRDAVLERLPEVTFICRFSDRTLLALGDPVDLPAEAISDLRMPSVPVEGMSIILPATISILDLDLGSLDAEEVIRNIITADLAAPERHDPDGLHRFDPAAKAALEKRLHLLFALRDALEEEKGIEAHFQAKVEMTTGRIVGAEALCRWTLDGTPISPGTFIPLAETSGLSRPLTQVILRQVATFARSRRDKGLPFLRVAINLSLVDLGSRDFIDQLLRWTQDLRLSPDTLSFEVTESEIMRHPDQTLADLARIRAAGFRLAIDDFGTGHSSLSRIDRMPITTVKIDRAFVTPLTVDNCHGGIAAVTMAMARNLDLSVVAEGVETLAQHEALLALGCDVGQGFLYARPLNQVDFETLLDRGSILFPPPTPP
ncbi:MAG: EAL domain-containing protein [Rhodospirillum sp.]|nr:EAL domain-containing protein [Rhodospirillum sp.]MCF8490505.1 EAL domain-containing protein [Rhodospirillum sp.]MCF8500638.1 EAL domain-containing protein [Rhodospirillum sp.]